MKHKLSSAIKGLSIILTAGAIGLELWHLFAVGSQREIPTFLYPVFWLERFALITHGIEGMIALVYAPRKQQAPIPYGIYTFFVGTIGLLELFAMKEVMIEPNQECS